MEKRIRSLAEFIERVVEISEEWKASTEHQLWFRGEPDATAPMKLTPKLYRPEKPVPESIRHERFLFEEFQARGGPLSDEVDLDEIAGYLVMQHCGAPTRLLDWSDGALIALHFAIIERGSEPLKKDPCVYVLDPDWLDDDTSKLEPDEDEDSDSDWAIKRYLPIEENIEGKIIPSDPITFPLNQLLRRSAAQRSQFVLFGTDAVWLRDRADKRHSRLRSICIDRSTAGEIQSQLRAAGITESVIFPDLDGLGREMVDLWNRLRAE